MQARQDLRVAQISALFSVLPLDIARKVFRLVEDDTRAGDLALSKLLKRQARIEVAEMFVAVRYIGNTLARRAREDAGDFVGAIRYASRALQLEARAGAQAVRWPELKASERARLVGVPGVTLSGSSAFAIANLERVDMGARLTFDSFARRFIRSHVASCRAPRYLRGSWSRDGAAFLAEYAAAGMPTLHDKRVPTLKELREYVAAWEFRLWDTDETDDDEDSDEDE